MPLESANAQGQRWHSAASCRKICPITVVLVIIDSCRPSCADPPTAVLPSAEFCTVLSDGGLHPRRLGCIEHELQSCLYRPWGVQTELSHKLLHKVSALRMSICGAVQIATHRWTLFSLQLAKRHSSLSLTHSIEAA